MRRSKAAPANSGELHLTIVEGRHLRRTAWYGGLLKRLSPVCIVHVGRQQHTTEIHEDGGSSPFWNALFTFVVDEHSTTIDIQLMTTSMCKLAPLGVVTIPIDVKAWRDRELRDMWVPVTLGKGTTTAASSSSSSTPKYGELRVKVEFKLASTLYKHPSVITLPVRRNDQAGAAVSDAVVTSTPPSAVSAPPPSPSKTSESSTAVKSSPLPSPNPSPAAPLPSPKPALGGPNGTIPAALQPLNRYFIDPLKLQLTASSGSAAAAQLNVLQVATYKNESVYLQHDMAAQRMATAFEIMPSFPKEHNLLLLTGFTILAPNKPAGVIEFAPVLAPPSRGWTKDKVQIALDVCRAMVQLHMAKVVHGSIRLSHVHRHPHGKARLVAFPPTPPTSEIPAPWAAPELEVATSLAPKMDVFAFGVFLMELDQGHTPFASEVATAASRADFIKGFSGWDVDDAVARSVSTQCPPTITALIQKCLAVAPANRPTSLVVLDLLRETKDQLPPGPKG